MQPLGTSRWRLRKEGLRCVGLQVNFSTMLLGYQRHISQLELSETESKKVDNTSNPSKVLYPWLISLLFDFDRSLGQEVHAAHELIGLHVSLLSLFHSTYTPAGHIVQITWLISASILFLAP